MLVQLPYGKGFVEVEVPPHAAVMYPPEVPGVVYEEIEIRRAMDHPIGSVSVRQLAAGRSDAVVVINDITRPVPSRIMLEEILVDLTEAGMREEAVTVVIACGNHRPNTPQEIAQMVGKDLSSRLRIINHDCEDEDNLTFVGETDTGLPIWVNSFVAHASLTILTGVVTPHHAAGYSGGGKSVVPGTAGMMTLTKHHSFPIRPYRPALGWIEGNPFHEELVKGARLVAVDFILNVVKNSSGEIVKAVAGDLEAAHEEGVVVCEQAWVTRVPKKYDIAVVTPGGHPRDIDLHQAQKAMSAAEMILDENGIIVLIAECPEGIGKFAAWLKEAESPGHVIERFRCEGFTPEHSSKAFMCARALERYAVIVACSGITKNELEQMFFQYAPSPQAAIEEALAQKGVHSSVLVLPLAASCVPTL